MSGDRRSIVWLNSWTPCIAWGFFPGFCGDKVCTLILASISLASKILLFSPFKLLPSRILVSAMLSYFLYLVFDAILVALVGNTSFDLHYFIRVVLLPGVWLVYRSCGASFDKQLLTELKICWISFSAFLCSSSCADLRMSKAFWLSWAIC